MMADSLPRKNEETSFESVDGENERNPQQLHGDDQSDDNVFTTTTSCEDNSVVEPTEAKDLVTNTQAKENVVHETASISTVTVATTKRRPSYTSKAPSALTNLGNNNSIDDRPYSPATSVPNERLLQVPSTTEINNYLLGSRQSTSRSSSRDMLASLHNQTSFDESLDEYSNPGTPSSYRAESPAPSPIPGQKRSLDHNKQLQQAYNKNYKTKWEEAARANILAVKCRETMAELHKVKLGSGSKGKSIKVGDTWKTPIEFETFAGRGACKDWKRSIRFGGQPLQKLIEKGILTPHAISCTCGICCGDDTITGQVKLFVPYTKTKRRRKEMDSMSMSNRFSSSIESFDGSKGDGHHLRGRSVSCDSDVFTLPHQSSTATDNGEDVAAMPPMTPVTPMTPMTPLTPLGLNMSHSFHTSLGGSLSQRPQSPPRSIMLSVPNFSSSVSSVPSTVSVFNNTNGSSHSLTIKGPAANDNNNKTNGSIKDGNVNMVSQQHWMQLEEVANNILSMANQLKILVSQAKVQAEASKEAAVAQVRLQAENDKREALNHIRFQSLAQMSQLSHVLANDVTKSAVCKLCQNCGREALLECTGCCRVYYCGNYCQRKDWNGHQRFCRENPQSQSQDNS